MVLDLICLCFLQYIGIIISLEIGLGYKKFMFLLNWSYLWFLF